MWIPLKSEELRVALVKKNPDHLKQLPHFLNDWINQPQMTGAPQLSYNNNFARAIINILPNGLSNKQAILKEWLPIAKNESSWQEHIGLFSIAAKQLMIMTIKMI